MQILIPGNIQSLPAVYLTVLHHEVWQVTTVDGAVDLRIPAGTQPGTTLVMAKRGVPRLGSDSIRGDHQVRMGYFAIFRSSG